MTLRPITPILLPEGHPRAEDLGVQPVFRTVAPQMLMVDETYQRELSNASVTLIRRIVQNWSWRRFKPPVCVDLGSYLHVIDGQHTAIAALTHGGIREIPVMIVDAPEMVDRARAFVGHNRDRINVTGLQIHRAMLAAGDEDALNVEAVCKRAGARLLLYPPGNHVYEPGDTMALATIKGLISKLGVQRARVALQVCADAKLAPISADILKAVGEVLYARAYVGEIKPDALTEVLRAQYGAAVGEAKAVSVTKDLPLWKALVVVLYQRGRKRGRAAAA